MSRRAVEDTIDRETFEAEAPKILHRLRGAFLRHGIEVRGLMFVHALEQLTRRPPEPRLDAGWPRVNPLDGGVNT